ncbi:hypothetical protein [Amycolatopsis vancoresmycina]|uniref:Uncharacterized protein n=1 Tax=Amycolatopsis vancoresmycina DSM 44592 TaxID=1292037 RepID=R1IDF6_9PSEU|nr:hypothetical protein [Amycolatopsis vancoresmycina]EOD68434.1 hypothetical protein H480_11282 [Amycolatopsis vancoresmycina DSM 44592]
MRLENTTSWRASWGSESEIDVALYIRDALALSVSEGQVLPPVEPQVPVHVPPGVDRAAVQAQWADWWVDLLAFLRQREDPDPRSPRTRYGRPALAVGSAMRQAVDFFGPAAARHFANARGPALRGAGEPMGGTPWAPGFYRRQIVASERLGQLVREAEVRLGRRAYPFRLNVIEISVAGAIWLRTADDQLLVSSRLAEDGPGLEVVLRTVIDELV